MRALLTLLALVEFATAKCACGYSVNDTGDPYHAVFTDLFETDFLHMNDVVSGSPQSTGWVPQNYSQLKSSLQSQEAYGLQKQSRNLVSNAISNRYDWFGSGLLGDDPGLQLWVRSDLINNDDKKLVPVAELVSGRSDILYGSFRVAMKTTSVNGTCSAFYFYRNDSQEIDLEILSSEQNQPPPNYRLIHLVVQNNQRTLIDGWPAPHKIAYRAEHFPPDENYNEYRFDWLPDRIDFYVNSKHMWTLKGASPSTSGRIHLSHWSNGDPFWSQGPPEEDAVTTVSYVKAYFNSTNSTRMSDYYGICGSSNSDAASETCQIPDQTDAPNPFGFNGNDTGHTFFFSQQHNMSNGQITYDSEAKRAIANGVSGAIVLVWCYLFIVVHPAF